MNSALIFTAGMLFWPVCNLLWVALYRSIKAISETRAVLKYGLKPGSGIWTYFWLVPALLWSRFWSETTLGD